MESTFIPSLQLQCLQTSDADSCESSHQLLFTPAAVHLYLQVGGVMVRDAVKHQILPLVMLKYNSALVDRPTPGISAVRSSLLLSVQFQRWAFVPHWGCSITREMYTGTLSVQFKRRASEVAQLPGRRESVNCNCVALKSLVSLATTSYRLLAIAPKKVVHCSQERALGCFTLC